MEQTYPHTVDVVHTFKNGRLHIEQILVPAVSIWQFRKGSGGRILGMPYYWRAENGSLFFFQVTAQTDVKDLERLIEKGKVFIRSYEVARALEIQFGRFSSFNF